MVKKCCVTNCNGNSKKGDSVFRFPQDPTENKRWRAAIPRDNIPQSLDTVVCARHWPANYEFVVYRGKKRPVHPPSVFPNIAPSLIPTPPSNPRTTIASRPSCRNVIPDQQNAFNELDVIKSFNEMKTKLIDNQYNFNRFQISSYWFNGSINIQSLQLEEPSCIPSFLMKIFPDFTYVAFHCGVRCTITPLSSNRLKIIKSWSVMEEGISFLNSMEKCRKKEVILEQISAMSSVVRVGDKKYEAETVIRAFEYFATSRTLYKRLREDYELPSISTLTRLTSKVNKIDDTQVIKNVFYNVEEKQKTCILLIDEVYVKPSLMYHGGSVFGKAVNKPDELANTMLAFFVVTFFGGPKFLLRMIPIRGLDAAFMFNETSKVIDCVMNAGGTISSIICDNSRVNQAFFKLFDCHIEKPWLTKDGIFLLFDFVHLVKSIRNNWLTERTQELQFLHEDKMYTARWGDLISLYQSQENDLAKTARLSKVSVFPTPIERQKVSTCLKIFSEETIAALKTSTSVTSNDGTILLIEKIVNFWKIVNCKDQFGNIRLNDPQRAPITSIDDFKLNFLLGFADMTEAMKPSHKRMKTLTKDTARSLSHTCRGLAGLAKYLISTSHEYVLLGLFTTDFLEKMFGKIRQGSGGTYFINVQQVLEKLSIHKTKLLLNLKVDVASFNVESGHSCEKCKFLMDENAIDVFDNLEALEKSLPVEVKETLVYISGYLIHKDPPLEGTFEYFTKFGNFTNEMNRGKLAMPNDSVCQFVFFAYILFHEIMNSVCRKSLCNALMVISDIYSLNIEKKHGFTLANILLNNYCHLFTPRSSKEGKQKLLKLSVAL